MYGPDGELAAEYGVPAADTAFTGAPLFVTPLFVNQDQIGSVRLVAKSGVAVSCRDFLPFGEEVPKTAGRTGLGCYGVSVAGDGTARFGGLIADGETSFGFFEARYLHGAPRAVWVKAWRKH